MKHVAVVGIGSPHGADKTGWRVIECLKQRRLLHVPDNIRVQLVACDRPGMVLLDYIKDASLAILVDAVLGGKQGTIRQLQADELMDNQQQFSSHDAGVAEALLLGAKLNMLPGTVILYGVEIGDDLQNDNTSDNAIGRVCERIAEDVETWLVDQS